MTDKEWIELIRKFIPSLDELKEEAVADQNFEAASTLRDAAYKLRIFVHKGEEREAFEKSMGKNEENRDE